MRGRVPAGHDTCVPRAQPEPLSPVWTTPLLLSRVFDCASLWIFAQFHRGRETSSVCNRVDNESRNNGATSKW